MVCSRVPRVVAEQRKWRESFVVSAQTLCQKGLTNTPCHIVCFICRFCASYSMDIASLCYEFSKMNIRSVAEWCVKLIHNKIHCLCCFNAAFFQSLLFYSVAYFLLNIMSDCVVPIIIIVWPTTVSALCCTKDAMFAATLLWKPLTARSFQNLTYDLVYP